MTVIKNELTGQEIHLAETNDITKLRNQLMLLGINGLFYSPWAKEIQQKIKEIEQCQIH
jgi:hypothetical protein